jgi:RHS repeat-associated protein
MTKTILLLKYGIESVYEPFIGDNEVSFLYGFNEERVRMTESYNTMERQKTYVANCELITESESGIVTDKSWTFLTCPTGVFAVVEKQGNTETLHYILKDHQGSWMVVTDAEGTVEQELSYDAWGNLRDPDTWCVDTTIKPMFDRGYTGQEHLTAFGLVNMNGRMYDPVMSSFLSVDRYVQQPGNSQGFNRYAYCMYNPLRYTDPSGWKKQGREPSSGNYEHWSMRYAVPLYEPRDYQNPYYLFNLAFFGNYEGRICEGGGSIGGGGATSYSFESSYGYYVTHYANSVYNYCFPSTQLQLIRNWQENPCYRTNLDLREAGISGLTVGVVCGQINGVSGYRYSCYQWSNDMGNTYSTALFDYVGGNANEYYSMSNQPLRMYGWDDGVIGKANIMAQIVGVPMGTINEGMEMAAKSYHNVSLLKVNSGLSKTQKVAALTKEGNAILRASRIAGTACGVLSAGISIYQGVEFYSNGGKGMEVAGKTIADVGVVIMGLLGGPVGLAVSIGYLVTDWATGGFGVSYEIKP